MFIFLNKIEKLATAGVVCEKISGSGRTSERRSFKMNVIVENDRAKLSPLLPLQVRCRFR